MLNKIYNILMKLGHYICHQKPERSFFIRNYQFPVCARCTGVLIGFFISLFLLYFKIYIINFFFSIILTLIMVIDWLLQNLLTKKSNNIRRLITGLIGGFGLSFFYYYIIISIIRFI